MRNSQKLGLLSLAQILHADGVLSVQEVDEVEDESRQTGEKIGDIVLARGLATEYEIARAIVSQLQIPYVPPASYDIPDEVKTLLPAALLSAHHVAPLDTFGDVLVLATWGDIDPELILEIEGSTRHKVSFVISLRAEIDSILKEKFPQLDVGQEVASRLDQLFGG